MLDNSSPAAPPRGAHDGPPPSGASQPGRRGAAPCPSQFLNERTEVIHQCAREAGHPGVHLNRDRPDRWTGLTYWGDLLWYDEHALGGVR